MDGKLFWTLALVGIFVVIGIIDGCKHGGHGGRLCNCDGEVQLPSYSRPWQIERSLQPAPITLSLPMMQPQSIAPVCQYCGGLNREYRRYTPRNEAVSSSGYHCRCSPRRHHYRYNDY